MTNPLDGMQEELAKMEAMALLDAIPALPEGTLTKIAEVSRANALVQLTTIMSDEVRDDMVRMGAANIVLQATQPQALPPTAIVQVHREDVEESE